MTAHAWDGVAPAAPVLVCDVDLDGPLPSLPAVGEDGRRYAAAFVLVRVGGAPIGTVEPPMAATGVPAAALSAAITQKLGTAPAAPPASAAVGGGLSISVVVCTRDRVERLADCLAALGRQSHAEFDVVVVDNAPTSDATERLVAASGGRVRRVVEPRPGLAWARNRGLAEAGGDIVAFIDDDELADPGWLAAIARAFATYDGVACVSGPILPAELDTPAQVMFERLGGHSKGHGFTPAVFDAASHRGQHPLYPLPPFGAGGNMAFDRRVLAGLGGFDVALGAGTPALGSEDTAAICDLMLAGHTVVYWPSALVRHHHYRDFAGLARQVTGYGTGLGAFYARALLRDPAAAVTLARLASRGWRDLTAPPASDDDPGMPGVLRRARWRGLLAGPAAYLRSVHRQRRLARAPRPADAEQPPAGHRRRRLDRATHVGDAERPALPVPDPGAAR